MTGKDTKDKADEAAAGAAAAVAEPKAEPKKELTPAEQQAAIAADVRQAAVLLRRAVSGADSRVVGRVLRQINAVRRKIWGQTLVKIVDHAFPADHPSRSSLMDLASKLPAVPAGTDVDMSDAPSPAATTAAGDGDAARAMLPEYEVFLTLLVLVVAMDHGLRDETVALSSALVTRLGTWNRRTMEQLAARAYFCYARAHELAGRLSDTRASLLALFRTASLRHDDTNQAVLLNLLLRNYLEYNLYEQAELLVGKARFPENAPNSQAARYMYYLGRIRAVQLRYSDAYGSLLQAARKAPQHAAAAGFRLAVLKLQVLVELLMGDVPERSVFRAAQQQRALLPYLQLTQAVRVGDLKRFQAVVDEHCATFRADRTFTLILRLRHTVIKTGLRKINLAYSCISFADIAQKLHLESKEVAEGVVANAIAEGVIAATIEHDGGLVRTRPAADVYATHQPAAAFHRRVGFCADIAEQAVRAMMFPAGAKLDGIESAEERRRRMAEEQELASIMADPDVDDGGDDF